MRMFRAGDNLKKHVICTPLETTGIFGISIQKGEQIIIRKGKGWVSGKRISKSSPIKTAEHWEGFSIGQQVPNNLRYLYRNEKVDQLLLDFIRVRNRDGIA